MPFSRLGYESLLSKVRYSLPTDKKHKKTEDLTPNLLKVCYFLQKVTTELIEANGNIA